MADIREQIRALAAQHGLARRLAGRPDIFGLAAHLVACQDAHRAGTALPPLPEAVLTGLPTADEIASLLLHTVEFGTAENDAGLAVPGGVRHPLLHWSPLVQLERLQSQDGRVAGRPVDALPHDVPNLVRWLEVSMGLRAPDWVHPARTAAGRYLDEVDEETETKAAALDVAREDFEARFGFSIEGLAAWLLDFRASDPVLYILLLSREYLLALRHCPALGEMPEEQPIPHLPKLTLPPIVAAMTIGELQRLVALYRSLVTNGPTTTEDVRAVVGERALSKTKRGRKAAAQIRQWSGTGGVLDRAPMHAEALRKRLFLIPGRDLTKLERHSMLRSWREARADWDNARSSAVRYGAHEMIAATFAPDIYSKRTRGRGLADYADPLDLYYGVPHAHLLHLGVTELGRALTDLVDRPSSMAVAARIMEVIGGAAPPSEGEQLRDTSKHERSHKKAVNELALFLPKFPNRGSAGRFVAAVWLNPHRDAALYRHLLQPVRSGDPRLARGGKRGKFYQALWFLQACFPALYRYIRARRFSVRIVCDLATSASVLTSDPIFHSILRQAVEETFPKAKRRKNGEPRKPAKSNLRNATRASVKRDDVMEEITRAKRGRSR